MADDLEERKRILRRVRKQGYGFDLFESNDKSIEFADGWSNFGITSYVSKVNFYQVLGGKVNSGSEDNEVGQDEVIELRENFLTLAMPTIAWVRLAERILSTLKSNIEEVSEDSAKQIKQIETIAKKLGD